MRPRLDERLPRCLVAQTWMPRLAAHVRFEGGGTPPLLLSLLLVALLAGCSANKPVLYPNQKLTQVGQATADRDVAECQQLAEQYVKSGGADGEMAGRAARNTAVGAGTGAAAGAVGGAIGGNAGHGAAVGAATGATAGLVGTFFDSMFSKSQPDPTYANFVSRCLSERGYEVVGWE